MLYYVSGGDGLLYYVSGGDKLLYYVSDGDGMWYYDASSGCGKKRDSQVKPGGDGLW